MNRIMKKPVLFLTGLAALVAVDSAQAEFKYSDLEAFNSRHAQMERDIINPETGMKGALYSARTMYNTIRIIEGKEPLKGEELFRAMTKEMKLPNGKVEYILKPDLFKGKEHYLNEADVNPKDNSISPPEAKAFYENIRGK